MRHSLPAIPLAGPLTLFLLGGVLGLISSYDPALGLPWLVSLFGGAALYAAVCLFGRTPARLALAAALLIVVAAAYAAFLATQYRHLDFDAKFGAVASLGALTSAPFPALSTARVDANAAAAFLGAALPLAAGLALSARRLPRLAFAGAALAIGYGTLLTASRGAWVALAVAGAAWAAGAVWVRSGARSQEPGNREPGARGQGARSQETGDQETRRQGEESPRPSSLVPRHASLVTRRRSIALALGLGAALLAGGLLLSQTPGVQRLLASASARASDRLILYRNSFFLALDFPLSGVGPGVVFGAAYSHFQLLILRPFVGYAHNLLLGIWLAQGLLGLLGFGGLLLASSRLIVRGLRAAGGPPVGLRWGAAVGGLAALLHGLTDAPQYDTAWPAMLMIFGVFGVAVAAARLADDQALQWIRLTPRRLAGAGAAALLLAALLGPRALAAASANVAAAIEARAALSPALADGEREELMAEAIRWADRGLRLAPASAPANARRGRLALMADEPETAAARLERAHAALPASQAIRKGLGYAYVWSGRAEEGAALLSGLDRAEEVARELETWPVAWRERGREDLAVRAERAAALMAVER